MKYKFQQVASSIEKSKNSDLQFLADIAQKSYEVRMAQRKYFATKSADALQDSKRLERELDMLLSRRADDLFGGEF